jgi:hypothetical protein
MIELLKGFPENVVAVTAKGNVTRADYETVLLPTIGKTFERYDKIRVYYELGPAFLSIESGAVWEDFKVGVGHWRHWDRVAVVTDVDWIRRAASAFAFLMPTPVRTFSVAQESEARRWIAAA